MHVFNKTFLPFDRKGYFSSIVTDYLSGNKKLKSFYKYLPVISSFKQAIQDKKRQSINRGLLVDVLKAQYLKNPKSEIRNPKLRINIDLLLKQNTFTVTTGHQLCLFTGPLYFIYKIISTINLAEQLKKSYPGYNFVPVYWMASEDHDFEEINHIHLFGKTLRWDVERPARSNVERPARSSKEPMNKVPCGKISTGTLKPVLEELSTILGNSENAGKLLALFTGSYVNHKNLSEATRYLVNELFGEYGLVIIDGDDKRLKNEFKSVIEDDILKHTAFQLVNSTNRKLFKNYKIQVNPREINCFYLGDSSRERIIKVNPAASNQKPATRNQQPEARSQTQELIKELQTHPERFSPNVVLRPLYQEKILPNLATVGGGAELAYWLQLKSVFEHYKMNFPVLVLRNSVMLIDKNTGTRLNKLGIKQEQLFNETDRLIKDFLKRTSKTVLTLDAEKKKITEVFKDIIIKTEKTDASLKAAAEAELQKQLNGLETIENKLLRAEKRKQETNVSQIGKIKEKLFPCNMLQERYDNFIPYYLKYGKEFISMLKHELDPLELKFTVLAED